MAATAKNITEKKLTSMPAGGALIGKREGQTIIHNDGSLGGYAGGRLHKKGGIKGIVKGSGQPIEFQGEEIILTAPVASDTTIHTLDGVQMTKRQIASKFNVDNGGVSFAEAGMKVPRKVRCTGKSYNFGGKLMTDKEIIHNCGCNHAAGGLVNGKKMKKAIAIIKKLQPTDKLKQYEIIAAKANPQAFLQMISDQALGYGRSPDGTRSNTPVAMGGRKKQVIEKYGKELTGLAIELYPVEEKETIIIGSYAKVGDYIDNGDTHGSIISEIWRDRVYWEAGTYPTYKQWCLISDLQLHPDHNGELVEDKDWNEESNHNYWIATNIHYSSGGTVPDTTESYKIRYFNKETKKVEDKIFTGPTAFEDAVAWGRATLENFNSDLVQKNYEAGGKVNKEFDYATAKQLLEEKGYIIENAFQEGTNHWFTVTSTRYEGRNPNIRNDVEQIASQIGADDFGFDIMYGSDNKFYFDFPENEFKAGGQLKPLILTPYQEKILFRLHLQPNGFVEVHKQHVKDLKALQTKSLIYQTSSHKNHPHIEIRLTDTGKEFVAYHKFATQNKKLGGVIDGDTPVREGFTFFRGINANYKNPFELNKAIEEFVDTIEPGEEITVPEKVFISYYSGYGGLEKFGAKGKGLLYEYFTPDAIVKKMWGLAYHHGYKGGTVAEPSCGAGVFIKYAPDQRLVTGYEINEYSHKICKLLFPQANIKLGAFETQFIKNNSSIKARTDGLPKFDLVIGNPPYGDFGGIYAGMGEKTYTRAENYIDYFIFRGLDLLKKDGLLIYIIGTEVANGGTPWLDKGVTKIKAEIMEKCNILDAYRLPNGVFDRTDVLSDIIVLQKK